MSFKNKSVCVTGATGFIGQHLVSKLISLNFDVKPVLRTSSKSNLKIDSFEDYPSADILVHLGQPSVKSFFDQASKSEINKLLRSTEALISKNYKSIIYASSSSVYGDKNTNKCKTYFQTFDTSPYNKFKLDSEKLILNSGGTVARLSNVYGPLMSETNVFSEILKQLEIKSPLQLQTLHPVRDFIWVGDVVDALIMMITEGSSGIYNIGSGAGISIQDLANLILKMSGQRERTIVQTGAEEGYSSNILDNSKMRIELGWAPKVSIEDGVGLLLGNKKR